MRRVDVAAVRAVRPHAEYRVAKDAWAGVGVRIRVGVRVRVRVRARVRVRCRVRVRARVRAGVRTPVQVAQGVSAITRPACTSRLPGQGWG